jgi:hypothetical protein
MPMPLPDYVPSPVREIILSKYGEKGMRALAADVGASYGAIVNNLKGKKHLTLHLFLELADRLDVSPESLAEIFAVPAPMRKEWLAAFLDKPGRQLYHLSPLGTADRYLYGIASAQHGNLIPKIYLPLCSRLGLTLSELASCLKSADE